MGKLSDYVINRLILETQSPSSKLHEHLSRQFTKLKAKNRYSI